MWSGADEVAELDASGNVLRRFVPDGTGGMDARLATVEAAGTVAWHHTDHLGSVIATSNASGQVTTLATYSPYGEFGSGQTAPPTGSPFGYTGRQFDAETGLYQYRARYYSPRLGRFLSTDPIGTKDDPNLYLYVGNDPVNGTDPTGLHTCSGSTSICSAIQGSYSTLYSAAQNLPAGSPERARVDAALSRLSYAGDPNKLHFQVGSPGGVANASLLPNGTVQVSVDAAGFLAATNNGSDTQAVAEIVGHEVDHGIVAEARGNVTLATPNIRQELTDREVSASTTQSAVAQGVGAASNWGVYVPGNPAATAAGILSNAQKSVTSACNQVVAAGGTC